MDRDGHLLDRQITTSLNGKKYSGLYYGYVVLAACFLIMTFVFGAQYSFGVFFKPMLNEFDWTRASTSGPFSLYVVLSGLLSIIAGRLSDRFGPKKVITFGGVIFGSGYLLMSGIHSLWQLYLCYGIMVAVGASAMYVPVVSMLARWFPRRRGLMVGFGVSGIGFGIAVVPIIASQLIISFNWRTSLLIVGAISLVSIVLLAQLLKSNPETMVTDSNKNKEADVPIQYKSLSLRESAKTRQFWMLFTAWIFYGFFFQIGLVHTVPYATDLGMSALVAASLLTIIGILGALGRISLGFAADKFGNKYVIFISLIVLAVAFLGVSVSGTVGMLFIFAVLYGVFFGMGVLLAPIAAEYFGLGALGAITGAINFSNNLGGALSPVLAGYIFDTTGSYRLAFILCSILGVAAAIIIWLLRPALKN